MMLSDIDIVRELNNGRIDIEPLEITNIQPASVDLTLWPEFCTFDGMATTPASGEYRLDPGEFLLGHTAERVKLGQAFAAQLNGKSTWGREGLIVHCTAGFVDPGFDGHLVLELTNVAPKPFLLRVGMRIAQLHFVQLRTPASLAYGADRYRSHYQGQTGATPSWRFEKQEGQHVEHW